MHPITTDDGDEVLTLREVARILKAIYKAGLRTDPQPWAGKEHHTVARLHDSQQDEAGAEERPASVAERFDRSPDPQKVKLLRNTRNRLRRLRGVSHRCLSEMPHLIL